MDITIENFHDGETGVGEEYFDNFRSHRTTKLFLADEETMAYMEEGMSVTRLRKTINYLVDYVNNHFGWTVVGWVRTGTVSDMSNERKMWQMRMCNHIWFLLLLVG